jgi:uncharacterized tellurite resistance protein B-like protein
MVPQAIAFLECRRVVGAANPFKRMTKAKMIVLHQPVSDLNRQAAKTHLDEILQILSRPGGFAKLNSIQRKFLMGIVLAAIVPADKRIRNIELERLQVMLKATLSINGSVVVESLALAEGQYKLDESLEAIAKALPDLLGIEDRCMLISNLWELALCDNELHSFEEKMVLQVADLSGVPRKKVAELMARAAARA